MDRRQEEFNLHRYIMLQQTAADQVHTEHLLILYLREAMWGLVHILRDRPVVLPIQDRPVAPIQDRLIAEVHQAPDPGVQVDHPHQAADPGLPVVVDQEGDS
jgi:hypothetical protein